MIAEKSGFDHNRHGFWVCKLKVPKGYEVIKEGKTKEGDLVMVMIPPFPERFKRGGKDTRIKGKWEPIETQYIGLSVRELHSVIRRNNRGKL